jgi:predicted aspartyl protease
MSVPFDAQHNLIVVPVRLWGPNGTAVVQLALDTGATSTLLNAGPLVALGYDPASIAERVQVTTGSSVEFAPRIVLQRIEALGHIRMSFRALCHTLPPSTRVDGLLGLDFLRGRSLVVDFRAGEITLS